MAEISKEVVGTKREIEFQRQEFADENDVKGYEVEIEYETGPGDVVIGATLTIEGSS